MTRDFSKLDKAKLDLIRLKNKHEELSDMTLRDQTQIQFIEGEIEKKNSWIGELQVEKDNDPVEIMRKDMQSGDDVSIKIEELF